MNPLAPIGVFDSGVGGLSVLRALRAELPGEDFVYFADSGFAPYGERSDAYVIERTQAVTRELLQKHGVKALVIACNTATAAAVHLVRAAHPDLPLVGVEPALKPAAAISKTRRIGVIATRGTLGSAKFLALHESLKVQAQFILQPCDGLADAIERGDTLRISALCGQYVGAMRGIDTLVLGCTHYPFASDILQPLVGAGVTLMETGQPVARQTRRLLEAAGLLSPDSAGTLALVGTGELAPLHAAASRWLG